MNPFNLIIDEFQEFFNINPSIYSEMQHYWDINKDKSRMNLLLSGSVYSLMQKIFQNSKEPLFGRATAYIRLKPFRTDVLKQILSDHNARYTDEDLLALYAFTGGVAKYVLLFMDNGIYTKKKMLDYMIQEDSLFISEGKNMLVEEFGKDYTVYFSILAAIARGEKYTRQNRSGCAERIRRLPLPLGKRFQSDRKTYTTIGKSRNEECTLLPVR